MKIARAMVLLFALAFFIVPTALFAQAGITIKVQRRWRLVLRATDLAGGAGTGFASVFESAADEVSVNISKTADPPAAWTVDIRRADSNWDPSVRLYVRRTSDGTEDPANIWDGTEYQEVTTLDQYFFGGTGDRSKVEIQYKVEGVSMALEVDTYLTEITYTVTQ